MDGRALLNVSKEPIFSGKNSNKRQSLMEGGSFLSECKSYIERSASCTGLYSYIAQTVPHRNIKSSSTCEQPQPQCKALAQTSTTKLPEDSRKLIQVESLQTRFLCFIMDHLFDICQLQGFRNMIYSQVLYLIYMDVCLKLCTC